VTKLGAPLLGVSASSANDVWVISRDAAILHR
jgi:hypothetical protein